jgi:hypothetical protein
MSVSWILDGGHGKLVWEQQSLAVDVVSAQALALALCGTVPIFLKPDIDFIEIETDILPCKPPISWSTIYVTEFLKEIYPTFNGETQLQKFHNGLNQEEETFIQEIVELDRRPACLKPRNAETEILNKLAIKYPEEELLHSYLKPIARPNQIKAPSSWHHRMAKARLINMLTTSSTKPRFVLEEASVSDLDFYWSAIGEANEYLRKTGQNGSVTMKNGQFYLAGKEAELYMALQWVEYQHTPRPIWFHHPQAKPLSSSFNIETSIVHVHTGL